MTCILTKVLLACAATLFASWAVLANLRRIAAASDAIARIPRSRLAAFLFFVAIATLSAQKGGNTNSPPQGAMPPRVVQRGEDLPRSGESGLEPVTNLRFTAISVLSNEVALSLAWPMNLLAGGDRLDFFAKAFSFTNRWEWIGCHEIASADTNLDVSVDFEQLTGTTNAPDAAFFFVSDRATSAATMRDSDGDGIPDVYELNNGTNPYVPDAALAPRLIVCDGGDYANLEDALEASEEYSIIELSAGEHELSDSLVMPSHPVMLTGPESGYAVLRSDADIAVVMLDGGQDSETLFRNIILVLEHRGNYQAGFWVGGNLPWSGLGASPTFDNVRVRAPYPDTLYYGWHYYRNDGGTSVVSRCTMNAAGAESVIGVYSYGGPAVEVDDCHFVNFSATNGNYATYFRSGANIVAEYAAPEPGLSWAGYPLDGEYSASADSDCDGLSDYDEIFTYDTDPWLADSDGDGVSDGDETVDETDPRDLSSHLLHIVAIVTAASQYENVTNYVAWGESGDGPWTNGLVAAIGASTNEFVIAGANATLVSAYWDFDRDGTYTPGIDDMMCSVVAWERGMAIVKLHLAAAGDLDQDGIPNWWEVLNANVGLSPTNAADAYLDPDSDGLINLHEYWANCDPLVYDGTNTVLSIMARSVDERLTNTLCACLYTNYNQAGVLSGLVINSNNWAKDVDLSCASPWNGWHANYEAGVLVTRRHVIFAKHFLFNHGEGDRKLYFRPRGGGVYYGVVSATRALNDTDIVVAILDEDVPLSISPVCILPEDYADYIGNGSGLPMLTLDFQEKTLVHDVVSFPLSVGDVAAKYPVSPLRMVHAESLIVGDSGNPRFLLMGNEPILISTLWYGADSAAAGPFIPSWRSEIQAAIDELSTTAGLNTNSYKLSEYDLSGWSKLPSGGIQ